MTDEVLARRVFFTRSRQTRGFSTYVLPRQQVASSDGIRFELAGWADSGAFAVHADTGTISRMPTPLDYESLARLQNDTTPTLCLTIRGTDGARRG